MIYVLEAPYIMNPRKNTKHLIDYFPGITLEDVLKKSGVRESFKRLGFSELVITINGFVVTDTSKCLDDQDSVAISLPHSDPGSWILGFTIFWGNTFLASAINTVLMVGAGMLINSIMSPGVPSISEGDTKPSYGFSGVRNETAPGNPVPVAYGTCFSTPQIIGSYRTVDNHDIWQYLLLCVSAGKTNNPWTEDQIFIGSNPGEPLTSFPNYTFGATDGDTVITTATRTALANFAKVHHDRPLERRIFHDDRASVDLISLLHFNTTASAEPLEDSGDRGSPDWTKYGSAGIGHTTPKFGSGYLELASDGDYIGTDDFEVLRFDVPFQMDMWIRVPDGTDRIFACKYVTVTDTYDIEHSLTTFGYIGGKLVFQSFSGIGSTIESVTAWTLNLDLSGVATLPINTWVFVRVQASYDSRTNSMAYQIKMEVAGVLSNIAYDFSGSVTNPDPNRTLDTALDYVDETPSQKSLYGQWLGNGYHLYGTSVTQIYGRCDIDEFRFCKGIDNLLTDEEVPTAELAAPVIVENDLILSSRSAINSARFIIEFTHGLFSSSSSGITNKSVKFTLGYRLADQSASTFVETTETCTANKTAAARFQFTIALPTRDKYEFLIRRLTPEDSNDENNQRSNSFLISFEEIIDLALYYPGMQIISLSIKATDFRSGTIDTIRVQHNRTLIDIPNWSGGTQSVDARVPAYQVIDMATNPYYGVKQSISDFDEDSVDESVAWTEELVGGNYRARSSIIFDERMTFSDVLQHIEQVGRFRVTRTGSTWVLKTDKPKTFSYVFSAGNIIKDSFQWSSYPADKISDGVEVTYWDYSKSGKRSTSGIATCSWYDTLTRIPKVANIEERGCITFEQARRSAILRANKNEFITRYGSFKALTRAIFLEVGDMVYITPPASKYAYGGVFPVDHENSIIVYLGKEVTLDQTTYAGKLHLYVSDYLGNPSVYEVLGPWDESTSVLDIDTPITAKAFDSWGLGRLSEDKMACQILKKTVSSDPKNRYVTLEFCQYSDEVFYSDEYGDTAI